jgi:hypothetical protein
MFRKMLFSVVGFLALGASTAVFADTGAAYKDQNGDTVQNQTSADGMTREETRWKKGGMLITKTKYIWDGCRWIDIPKDYHFWKKNKDGTWDKDSADKIINGPAGDVPNGGTAPTPGVGSGAASFASIPAYVPKAGSTAPGTPAPHLLMPPGKPARVEPFPGSKPAPGKPIWVRLPSGKLVIIPPKP